MKVTWKMLVGTSAFSLAFLNVAIAACAAAPTLEALPSGRPIHAMALGSSTPLKPDQINVAGWDKAWTNLVNDAEQTFVPSLPKLQGVEVELVLGNADATKNGADKDNLTLSVLDGTGKTVMSITQTIYASDCDHAMFVIPNGGIDVTPGDTYSLRLSGGTTFGWKYVGGGYPRGAALFNGKPLLPKARSTFLFRTFGAE
jgi:hypothetical protein